MGDLRRIKTVQGDGSQCWLCHQEDDEILFDAPAHGADTNRLGPKGEFVPGYSDVERLTLCYQCEAMRRWHALDLGEPEEETPAAVCFIKPIWSHAERARLTRMHKRWLEEKPAPEAVDDH